MEEAGSVEEMRRRGARGCVLLASQGVLLAELQCGLHDLRKQLDYHLLNLYHLLFL